MQNPSCKILDLSGHNGLNDINLLEQSMAIFATIAPNVESVNLSKRVLFLLGDRCEQLFSALPATVTHLMVEKHYKESGADFPKFFRHMPKTVTSLQINNFMDCVAHLKAMYQLIPQTVTNLNISYNGLMLPTTSDLRDSLKSIPNTVKTLTLAVEDITGLANKRGQTRQEWIDVASSLPHSIDRVDFVDNTPETAQLISIFNSNLLSARVEFAKHVHEECDLLQPEAAYEVMAFVGNFSERELLCAARAGRFFEPSAPAAPEKSKSEPEEGSEDQWGCLLM